eukprot:scaffold44_cov411-Prasinococcus_capsulatus_cf.AAC.34
MKRANTYLHEGGHSRDGVIAASMANVDALDVVKEYRLQQAFHVITSKEVAIVQMSANNYLVSEHRDQHIQSRGALSLTVANF